MAMRRRWLTCRHLPLGILLAVVAVVLPALGASAQSSLPRTGFLDPFPAGDVYRLHVVGDWYADGLRGSIADAFAGHARVKVQGDVVQLRTLRRSGWDGDISDIEAVSKRQPIDIAVVMFGVSEIGPVRSPGNRRIRFGDDEWKTEYAQRVDRLMKALKGRSGAVYWIGLPVVRRSDRNEGYAQINEIFRERAYVNGVKFIDIHSGFSDENGNYAAYGPDLEGKISLLRSGDGNYFTATGYRKLAHYAEREIRRDLARASAERTVPLAGNILEQRRINPRPAAPTGASGERKPPPRVAVAKSGDARPDVERTAAGRKFGGSRAELKADHGTIALALPQGRRTTPVTITIVRPAIPATVLDIVTRKQSPDRPAQLGDSVALTLPGGATLLSSVTPAGPALTGGRPGKLSPTQSPFFKVWAKGERLVPEKGRADDYEWPLPEPAPVVRTTSAPASREAAAPPPNGLPPPPAPNPLGAAAHRRR